MNQNAGDTIHVSLPVYVGDAAYGPTVKVQAGITLPFEVITRQ